MPSAGGTRDGGRAKKSNKTFGRNRRTRLPRGRRRVVNRRPCRRRSCRLTAVPMQPSETQARTLYQTLIAAFPDLALSTDARFELAELQSDRGEHDAAIKLLQEALDKEPSPELTDKVRVRLGAALLAKGDAKKALDQLTPIVNNPKSAMRAPSNLPRRANVSFSWAKRTRRSSCWPCSATRESFKICRA